MVSGEKPSLLNIAFVSVAQFENGAEDTVRRCSEEHTQEPVYFFCVYLQREWRDLRRGFKF